MQGARVPLIGWAVGPFVVALVKEDGTSGTFFKLALAPIFDCLVGTGPF